MGLQEERAPRKTLQANLSKDAFFIPKHCFSDIKVDCVSVSTLPVKTAIDDLLQRLFDTLLFTLRHSIQTDLQQMGQFLNDSIQTLSSRPQTIEEVAEANTKHHEFGKKKPEVRNSGY